MTCSHDLSERETACADGMCPVCLSLEVGRLERANATRPDYDLVCDECGRAHILDTSIPSAVWNKIARGSSILCTLCIDDRMQEEGLTAEAEFYFVGKALVSKLYNGSQGEIEYRDREIAALKEALERIKRMKPEPIGETGFSTGPLSLFQTCQRIARNALAGGADG